MSSLIVVAAIAIIISTMILPVLRVTGTSMNPTLKNDEVLLCNKLADIKQGDIIAFYCNNKVLIKRVIGLPGDVIDISEDGTVYVNGEVLDEPYAQLALGEKDVETPLSVPESRYFVCGDNLPSKVIQNNEFRATLKMPILRNYRRTANFRRLGDICRYWGDDTK